MLIQDIDFRLFKNESSSAGQQNWYTVQLFHTQSCDRIASVRTCQAGREDSMESFAVGGDTVEDVGEIAVYTTDNPNMFGNINELDGGVPDGDRNRVLKIFLFTREIRRKISLKFGFTWRQFDVVLAAEIKCKLKKEFQFD